MMDADGTGAEAVKQPLGWEGLPQVPVPDAVDVVLVPFDGSELAELALPVATQLAARLGAEVQLFSAVPTEDDVGKREAELAGIDLPGSRVVRLVVVDRDPPAAIHRALHDLDRATCVMATHGRGRSAAVLGSVADDVLARGGDPVVLVGPLVDYRLRSEGVVACVDETPESTTVLPAALTWARLLGEPLVVLTAAEPVPPEIAVGPVRRSFGPDGDVDAYLRRVARPLRGQGVDVQTKAVFSVIGPAAGVRAYIRAHPAVLVAVSSRVRRGLSRLAFGSVAAEIVRNSDSPVLAVHRPDSR
jgi:nucleotide-binding universal stress UspA family protein